MRIQFSKLALSAGVLLAMALTFSCSGGDDLSGGDNNGGGGKGNDIKNYKTVKIGSQTWMAENLNYNLSGSKCYGEDGKVAVGKTDDNELITGTLSNAEIQANCNKYGRLYDWATAMNLPSNCNYNSCSGQIGTKHRGICPSGWHIPSNADWDKLFKFVDNANGGSGGERYCAATGTCYESETAGKYLKTKSGWNEGGNGQDTYGFAALPGGGSEDGFFEGVGYGGLWWSASEYSAANRAYIRIVVYYGDEALYDRGDKDELFSVRCVQD